MSFFDGEIDIVIRDYICAQCFEDLHKEPTEGRKWLAVCLKHGDAEKAGRVTRKWAERQGQKLAGEYKNIRVKISRTEPKQPAEKLLSELGL